MTAASSTLPSCQWKTVSLERTLNSLIDHLKSIQSTHGYLPSEALESLSVTERVPLYEIQAVATFYPHFRLFPPPVVSIKICRDLSCHLKDGRDLYESVADMVDGIGFDDWEVETVSCLGQCDGAPAVSINDQSFTGVSLDSMGGYLERLAQNKPLKRQKSRTADGKRQIDPYNGKTDCQAMGQYLRETDADTLLETLKSSGLRGMGGAGFPTGVKWGLVRAEPGEEKYVVCNADESEPGTFKDRELLGSVPHLILEGIILAGLVTGAERGYIFLRHEYGREHQVLQRAIDEFYSRGFLGNDIMESGARFELSIFDSPGGYICGEETALLEALEGRRAEPRNKPPFPGTAGLHGKPTLINNVETFSWVPAIAMNGAEWFASQGRNGARGLKYIALSGHVRYPGVYEIPLGTTVRELIEEWGGGITGGRALKAFAPGGASSGFLPGALSGTPLDFDALANAGSMLGSGAVIAIAEGTDMLELTRNAMAFFKNESCGKCVPCRAGTRQFVSWLDLALAGRSDHTILGSAEDLADTMSQTSICGLGQAAPLSVLSVLKHFPEDVARYTEQS